MVKSMFFNSTTAEDTGAPASWYAEYWSKIVGDGILPDAPRDFLRVGKVPGTMNTVVAPGAIMVKGYMCMVDEPFELTHQQTPGGARTDYIVMRLDFTTDATGNGRAGSIYPTVTHEPLRENDVWDMLLAEVVIPENSIVIDAAAVTDRRADPDVCGFASWMGEYKDAGIGTEADMPRLRPGELFFTGDLWMGTPEGNRNLTEQFAVPTDMITERKIALGVGDWKLLKAYIDPGAVTWTAPDLLGDGSAYEIGVCMVSGGQSGGVGAGWQVYAYGRGGDGGEVYCFIQTVTPHQMINGVVGHGGEGTYYHNPVMGNYGGTTSFSGSRTWMGYGLSSANPGGGEGAFGGVAGTKGSGFLSRDIFNPLRVFASGGTGGHPGLGNPNLTYGGGGSGGSGVTSDINMTIIPPGDGEPGTGSGGGGGFVKNSIETLGGKGGSGSICIYVRRTTA